jgi:hypothetical protein
MSILEIPIALDTPLYTERVVLDGREYLFRFDWNGRESRWRFDIGTVEEVWLARGIKVLCGFPLLRRFTAETFPAGDLIAVDFSPDIETGEAPTFYELGRRVRLFYFPVDSDA